MLRRHPKQGHRLPTRIKTPPKAGRSRLLRQLTLERFEDRRVFAGNVGTGNPAPVFDTTEYPHSAVVQLDLYYDVDDDGEIDVGDYAGKCSGALIDDFHVLTAAHCIYNNKSGEFNSGWVDRVYVHAGRDSKYDRPFGEARAIRSSMVVTQDWQDGVYQDDLGIFAIDRNLGEYTGTLGYDVLANNEKEKVIDYFPRVGGFISDVSTRLGMGERTVPDRPKLSILHYPAERQQDGVRFKGQDQFLSTGRARSISIDGQVYHADLSSLWVTGGSSGSPVLDGGFDGSQDTVVGVLVRADRADPGADDGNVEITRLTNDWLDFINDVLDDNPAPTDKPSLVDYDRWFDAEDSSLSTSTAHAGDSVRVKIKVFNAGTATATDVPVTVSLYDSNLKEIATLGVPRIDSIAPFQSKFATIDVDVPIVASGEYSIGSRIDEFDEIDEFGTPWNDLVVTANSFKSGYGYIKSLGTLTLNSDVHFHDLTIINEKPVFASNSPQSFTVYQGEEISFNFDATDPEGRPIEWTLFRNSADMVLSGIDGPTGEFTWRVGPNVRPDTYTANIYAGDGFNRTKLPISIQVKDAQPVLKGLYSDHETIYSDGRDLVTLAAGVVKSLRPGKPVSRVEFYIDRNQNGVLDIDPNTGELIEPAQSGGPSIGTDEMIGFDTNGTDGRSWTGAIGGFTPGDVKVFAQAVRYGEFFDFRSAIATATIHIVAPPFIPPVAIPFRDDQLPLFAAGFTETRLQRDGQGRYYAIHASDSFPRGVEVQLLSNEGDPLGQAFTLPEAVANSDLGNVVVRPSGEILVIQTESSQFVARRYSSDGTPIGDGPLELGTFSDAGVSLMNVGVDENGNFLLVGSNNGFSPAKVLAKRFTWDGVPMGIETSLLQKELTSFQFGGMQMNASGQFVIWSLQWDFTLGDQQWSTRAQIFDANLSSHSGEFIIKSGCCSMGMPNLAINAAPDVVAVYEDGNLLAHRFDGQGQSLSDPIRINTSLLQRLDNSVALSDSGWFVVTWDVRNRDPGDGALDEGIYLQVVDSHNIPRGPETVVPVTVRADQSRPRVQMDADADLAVVWDDIPVRFRSSAPFGRAFEVNVPPQVEQVDTQTAVVGSEFQFTPTVTDLDRPSQSLAYALVEGAPSGIDLDPQNGKLTWTPTSEQAGQHSIGIRVTDDGTPAQSQDLIVPVTVVRPDVVVLSLTGNGNNTITLKYEVVNAAVTPFDVAFVRSVDGQFSNDDVRLGAASIAAPADLQMGLHSKTFTLGGGTGQIPFPGAGAPAVRSDFRILAVADPTDAVPEEDANPTSEDNTAPFTGAYHLPRGPVFVHGSSASDGLRLKKGSVVVSLNDEQWTFAEDDVTDVQAWLGDSGDLLEGNDVAVPIIAFGGPGGDVMSGGAGNDELIGGEGTDELLDSRGVDTVDSEPNEFAAPIIVPLNTTSDTTPVITWSTITGAVHYDLLLKDANGTVVKRDSSDTVSYSIADALVGGRYSVQVRAVDEGAQATTWSAPMSFTVDEPAPSAPTVAAPTGTQSSLRPTIRWSNVPGAAAYEIHVRRASNGELVLSESMPADADDYIPSVDLPETSLQVTVEAINSEGDHSAASNPQPFSIDIPVPEVPILTSPTGTIAETVPLLTWSTTQAVGSFEMQLDRTTAGSERSDLVHATGLPVGESGRSAYLVQQPLNNGSYAFRVRGINALGEPGDWSPYSAFVVDISGIPPSPPDILTVPPPQPTATLDFSWSLESQATSYEIWIEQITGEQTQTVLRRSGLEQAVLSLPHKLPIGQYRVQVRSENEMGASLWSSPVAFDLEKAGSGHRWQNDRLIWDVNDDQFVSPIDALVIINALNDQQSGPLPDRSSLVAPFYDTNGDDFLSSIDALFVINELNEPTRAAEGESLPITNAQENWLEGVVDSLVRATDVEQRRRRMAWFLEAHDH